MIDCLKLYAHVIVLVGWTLLLYAGVDAERSVRLMLVFLVIALVVSEEERGRRRRARR